MLRLAAERDVLRVVDDQIGSPTPARWIAAVTVALVARWQAGGDWNSGIVHLTASGQTSWYGFAAEIFDRAFEAGVLERKPRLEAIPASAYPTPAQRPAYSCLDTSRLRERYGITLPDWRKGVAQVLGELAS